jgi:hypothetical protein
VKTGVCVGGVVFGGPNHHNGFCKIVLPPGRRLGRAAALGASVVTQSADDVLGSQSGVIAMRFAPPPADPPSEPGVLARGIGAAGPA